MKLKCNVIPASECTTGWKKINQEENGVAWGARNSDDGKDSNGKWGVSSRTCGTKLMLVAVSGGVTCYPGYPLSNFGCSTTLRVYVTNGKGYEYTIAPKGLTGNYRLAGYNAASPFVEFPLENYCFETGTEYNLWYTEDMLDSSEGDNAGTAYTDIYICPSA